MRKYIPAIFAFWFLSIGGISYASTMVERLIEGSSVPSLAPIVDQAAPAVVNIATYTIRTRQNPLLQSPFFRRFFSLPNEPTLQKRTQSAGSGVIVDATNGYVLTNHHVIKGADEIEVTLQDGRQYQASLVGSDEKVDLAVLRIPPQDLKAIALAKSNSLKVGDFVLAIGSPFGLQQTVTSGIVSALGRNGLGIQGYEDFIQTDASINPGNSGGALIDLRGQLVGINSAILAPAGGNVGIGFAIPIEVANAVMNQLIRFGEVRRGGIGANFQDLTPELATAFSLKKYQGALVTRVTPDSSAAQAGLRQGDVIIASNGRPITTSQDIINRIGLSALGDTHVLTVLRGDQTLEIIVEVRSIPIPEASGETLHPTLSGARLKDLMAPNEDTSIGVIVADITPNSSAARNGFEIGDILFGLNQSRVRSLEELKFGVNNQTVQAYHVRRGYQELVIYVR